MVLRERPATLNALLLTATLVFTAFCAEVPDQFYLGMNFGGIADWGAEQVWKDIVKQSRPWVAQREGSPWGQGGPLALDSLGWVRSLDAGQRAESPLLGASSNTWSPTIPESTYLCLYDGTGTVNLFSTQSYNLVSPGRIEVRTRGTATPWVNLTSTDPTDYVRNIRFIRRDHEDSYLSQPWDESFLERWRPFPVIRFMDWQSTNNNASVSWSDRTLPGAQTQSLGNGVALEYMIDYCNRTNSQPWFCVPHRADDDYVRRFATMVRDNLAPHLVAYVEYSNECWNYIFSQTRYCDSLGLAQGLAPSGQGWEAGWRYYGRRSRQIFVIWEEVFGGTDRFVRVIASQMNTFVSARKLDQDNVFEKTDALAIAPYFGYQFGADRVSEVVNWSVEQLLDSCLAEIRDENRSAIQEHVDFIRDFNTSNGTNIKLIAYEGGQHLSAAGTSQAATDLFSAANRHPRMKDLYLTYFEQWAELGGKLFANFSTIGEPGIWGAWGVLEYPEQPRQDAPKYDALLELIERYPAPATSVKPSAPAATHTRARMTVRRNGGILTVVAARNATIELINAGGRLIERCTIGSDGEIKLGLDASKGMYVVRAKIAGREEHRTVMIQ